MRFSERRQPCTFATCLDYWFLLARTTKKGCDFFRTARQDFPKSPRRQTAQVSLRPRRRGGAVAGSARESARP